MEIRISLAEIEAAWPTGIRDLFQAKGVRLMDTGTPSDVGSIRFQEPCRWRWDHDGTLVIEQPEEGQPLPLLPS